MTERKGGRLLLFTAPVFTNERGRRGCYTFGAAAILWLGGCSVYHGAYQFLPRPAVTPTPAVGDNVPQSVTLVSVVGVRRADPRRSEPAVVEVRIRVTNSGPSVVGFDPNGLVLVAGDLEPFGSPRLSTQDPIQVTAHQSVTVTAFFPFPDQTVPSGMDLSAVNLSWELQINGRRVPLSTTLVRADPVGYCDGGHEDHWHGYRGDWLGHRFRYFRFPMRGP